MHSSRRSQRAIARALFSCLVLAPTAASGQAPAPTGNAAAGMVPVPASASGLPYDFFLDKYEASLVAGAVESVEGATPLTSISFIDARGACASRGLRLPTLQEWQAAADGTPDSSVCNVNLGAARVTGPATSACVSAHGAIDMVGNAAEVTDVKMSITSGTVSATVIDAAFQPGWNGASASAYDGKTWVGASGVPVRPITNWSAALGFPSTDGDPVAIDDATYYSANVQGFSVTRGGSYSSGADAGRYSFRNWSNVPTASIGFRCAHTSGQSRLAVGGVPAAGTGVYAIGATVAMTLDARPANAATASVDLFYRRGSDAGCTDRSLSGWTRLTETALDQSATTFAWDTSASLVGGPGQFHLCGRLDDGSTAVYSPLPKLRVGPVGFCQVNDALWTTSTTGCKLVKAGLSATGKSFSQAQSSTTWNAASAYCAALTEGGAAAGSWRLPTKQELVDVSGANAALTHLSNPPAAGQTPTFWTSTGSGAKHSIVDLRTGAVTTANDSGSRFRVCIRAN